MLSTNTEDVQTLRMYNQYYLYNKDEQTQILGLYNYTLCGCTNTVDVQKLSLFEYFEFTNTEDVKIKDVQTLWRQHLEYAYSKDKQTQTLGLFTNCGQRLWMEKFWGWTNSVDGQSLWLDNNWG